MTGAIHSVMDRRSFAAPCERVFDAFGRKDALARWFSPDRRIAVEILELEFRSGGAFRIRFSYPDGKAITLKGTYRSILPSREHSFSREWEEPEAVKTFYVALNEQERPDKTAGPSHHHRLKTNRGPGFSRSGRQAGP